MVQEQGSHGAALMIDGAEEEESSPKCFMATCTLAVVGVAALVSGMVFLVTYENNSSYQCKSSLDLGDVLVPEKKGLAIDLLTLGSCPGKIPKTWPNTQTGMKSLRLFEAPDSTRAIVDFAHANDVKVLVGSPITCLEDEDDLKWDKAKALLQDLGADHVLGVAFGNELELLVNLERSLVPYWCVKSIWAPGYLFSKIESRIVELDALGDEFKNTPVTSVFGAAILGGNPFLNSVNATVLDFIKAAVDKYQSRWVYSINIYPYFDGGNKLDPGSHTKCTASLSRSLCWSDSGSCTLAGITKAMRERMASVSSVNTLWITETGWSTPMASTLKGQATSYCTDFSSEASFKTYYSGFVSWDLQMTDAQGPDHVFYFTARDASNFGNEEGFGLIESCSTSQCKLQG